MLSANPTVLLNEIRKKQGRTIFALCRACGLAPADGAIAKFYLLKHGYVVEHSASSGLFLVNRNPQPAAAPVKRAPVENPYQVIRRNEPAKYQGEETGRLTSEAKRQREAAARQEESERLEAPVFVMAKPEPLVEKTVVEQLREEFAWLDQWEREQAELQEEVEAEEQVEEEFVEEPEPDAEVPDETETEPEDEEMANLGPTALSVLQKARAVVNEEEQKSVPIEQHAPIRMAPFGNELPVPTTDGKQPNVSDEMIVELLQKGPATMGQITAHFGRRGSALATKLSKMVKNGLISQREKVQGVLVVYLSNAEYLKEVGKSLPEQKLPVVAKSFNVERGTMLHTREQVTAVAVEKVEAGDVVASVDGGVKPATTLISSGTGDDSLNKAIEKQFGHKGSTVADLKLPTFESQYDIMEPKEKEEYLRQRILVSLQSGSKNVIVLATEMPNIPSADIHKMLGTLNQRRRILKCTPEEIPGEHVQSERKRYSFWKLAPVNGRTKRVLNTEDILAYFEEGAVLELSFLATEFQRVASSLAPTINALVREGQLIKVGESPAQYRKPNSNLASIIAEIDKSFSVKTMVEKPDENWFPILNRLETLIGGDAGASLAEIQAYLKRRLKDD